MILRDKKGVFTKGSTAPKHKEQCQCFRCTKTSPMAGKKNPKARHNPQVFKKGQTPWNKGTQMPEETRRKISAAKKGTIPWSKGKKFSHLTGEGHHAWKGDAVGYSGLHYWVKRKLGKPTECQSCGKTGCVLDWANIDHLYKRNLDDWQSLCRSCHRKHDYAILSV